MSKACNSMQGTDQLGRLTTGRNRRACPHHEGV